MTNEIKMIQIKINDVEYVARMILATNLDSSLRCQFFDSSSRLYFEVIFDYRFLFSYDDNLFNLKTIHTSDCSISYEETAPFLRYSINEFIKKIKTKDTKTNLKIEKIADIDIKLLEKYKIKQCEFFNEYKCNIADHVSDNVTTKPTCDNCSHPEYFEKCKNLISGKTIAERVNNKIARKHVDYFCKEQNQIKDIKNCISFDNKCFSPPDICKECNGQSRFNIFISSRCKEFESDRIIIKEDIEKLSTKVNVITIPESDDCVPTIQKIDEFSLEKASNSDLYILFIGKEFSDIVEKEFFKAINSRKTKPNKEILVYVKDLKDKDRDAKANNFIKKLKIDEKIVIKTFYNIRDLREKLVKRIKQILEETPVFMMKIESISEHERVLRESIKERLGKLSPEAKDVLKKFVGLGEIDIFRGEVKNMLGIVLKQSGGLIMAELQKFKFVNSKYHEDPMRGSQEIYSIEKAYRSILQELLFNEWV